MLRALVVSLTCQKMFTAPEPGFGELDWGIVSFDVSFEADLEYGTADFWLKYVAPHYPDPVAARMDLSTLYPRSTSLLVNLAKNLPDTDWLALLKHNFEEFASSDGVVVGAFGYRHRQEETRKDNQNTARHTGVHIRAYSWVSSVC